MYPFMSPEVFDREQQDRALLDEAQRVLVKKIIEQSSKAEDLTDDQVRIYSAAIARFQRVGVARDRIDVARRRIDASYTIARAHNDTQLEVARIRAEAARRRPDHPQVDEDDPLAPWGRKKDSTPYTHEEFRQSLNEAIRDIWGLKPINPNSYMPWEKRPDSDASLVAPDDPAVAGIPAEGSPDGKLEPPDIPDSAPFRARSASDECDDENAKDRGLSPDPDNGNAGRAGADGISRAPPFIGRNRD